MRNGKVVFVELFSFLSFFFSQRVQWFFSPTISPLRSFSFGSSKSLVFAMTSIGQQTWLCCKDKLYSFPSRDFQEAGLTKKSEEGSFFR